MDAELAHCGSVSDLRSVPHWYFISEFYANLLAVAVRQLLVTAALVVFASACDDTPPARHRPPNHGWACCWHAH